MMTVSGSVEGWEIIETATKQIYFNSCLLIFDKKLMMINFLFLLGSEKMSDDVKVLEDLCLSSDYI